MSGVIYGLAAVVLFTVILVLLARIVFNIAPGIPVVLAEWLLVGALLVIVVLGMEPAGGWVFAITNLAVYAFVTEVLIFIYSVASGSVSVAIITSMLVHEREPDAFQKALAEHSPERLFTYRLQRLDEQRLLMRSGDCFTLTPKGRRWVAVGSTLKAFLAVGSGG